MVRDDLFITVPSLFRCPISLDVMKSPVSLCTGVTYDRSSIQRWLDNGNNTCPATMQVLHSKDFVPNHTLQRLIQIWSNSVRHRSNSPDSPIQLVPSLSPDQARDLIKEIESKPEDCLECMSKIICFARESEESRKFLARIDGFVSLLVDFLGCGNANFLALEQVVRVLDMIISEHEDHKQLANSMLKSDRDCLSSILLVLQQGSAESRIASARVLESIAIDAESKLLIAEKDGLFSELIRIMSTETDPTMIESTLSCLIAVSMPRRIRPKIVRLGVVKQLTKLLSDPNWSVSVTEKALKLLEMASSCKEGKSEICENSECVSAIVQKMLKVSSTATEHAVTILWSVCYLSRDDRAQSTVTQNNGLTKILVLMQSNCSPAVRQLAGDLLKIFRVSSKSCLSSYDTKTTHIMPF
ncbi:hypothetical protein AAG906_025342 [Vitis piasezkii]